MSLHSELPAGVNHIAHNWEYANSTARLAATGFVVSDKYKLALQLDTMELYILTSESPITWQAMTQQISGVTSRPRAYFLTGS